MQAKFKQREQELISRAAARETELKTQAAAELQARTQEWKSRRWPGPAVENRAAQEAEQKELSTEVAPAGAAVAGAVRYAPVELQSQRDRDVRRRELETVEAAQREQHRWPSWRRRRKPIRSPKRKWATELELTRGSIEPLKSLLVRTEKERDEARARWMMRARGCSRTCGRNPSRRPPYSTVGRIATAWSGV